MIARVPSLLALLPLCATFAVAEAEAQEIVVLGSTAQIGTNALREDLMCTGEFVRVDFIDLTARTPTLDELRQYHGVLVFSDQPLVDPTGLGDRLYSYVSSGGGLVLAAGAFSSDTGVRGQLRTAGLVPVDDQPVTARQGNTPILPTSDAAWLPGDPGHPTMQGVNTFDGGDASFHATVTPADGALVTAVWDEDGDGVAEPDGDDIAAVVLAERMPSEGGRVAVANLYPLSERVVPISWTEASDGGRLLANVLLWAVRYQRPAGTCVNEVIVQDLDCDTVDVSNEPSVDESDPVCLQQPYPLNDDYYLDAGSFGCAIPTAPFDLDDDLISGTGRPVEITDPNDPNVILVFDLAWRQLPRGLQPLPVRPRLRSHR